MRFTFTIEVEVERVEGKFASRDDLGAQILDELESANPGSLTSENDGEYEVVDWSVEEQPQPKRRRKP
jgi:hypothetical protein